MTENYEQSGMCLTCMEDIADFKSGMPCCLHKMHAGEVVLTDNIAGYSFPVKVLHGCFSMSLLQSRLFSLFSVSGYYFSF